MTEVIEYEKVEFGSEIQESTKYVNYKSLIETEGVFVTKTYEDEKSRYKIYYIPSLDIFLNSLSDERDSHFFIEKVGFLLSEEKYRKMLNLNTNNNE